jgi:hypothetical protein
MATQVPADGRCLGRMGVQPARRFRPLERETGNAARFRHLSQRVQRRAQHGRLPLAVAGLPQQVAQRILDRREPGYVDRSRQIRNARQGNRAHARRFDRSLYQSHGPATDRSTGHQEDDIHPISLHVPDHGRRALFQEHLRLQDVTHERVVVGGTSLLALTWSSIFPLSGVVYLTSTRAVHRLSHLVRSLKQYDGLPFSS